MFGMFADLLSLLATTLFPLFATYKALCSPSPASLAPWLTFYATLSLLHLLESTVLYPLTYLPLYSWARLFLHLYLLLPAPQGATYVYNTYIQPWIAAYETEIDDLISQTHDRAKSAGLQYLKQAVEWVRVNVLGQRPHPPTPPQSQYGSYAQTLLSRFYSTSSTTGGAGTAPGGNDFYSAVLSALQNATAGSSAAKHSLVEDLSASGTLIPRELSNTQDRLTYIRQAREGLRVLLQAFDREEGDLSEERSSEGLAKSRSEGDFDKIERSEVSPSRGGKPAPQRTTSGSWMPWNWGGKEADPVGAEKKEEGPVVDVPAVGSSSGVDLS